MRSRRVLVLRLGFWGLGLDATSVRSDRKRSPRVRKRPRLKIAAKPRLVVTFGLALGLRVSKVSTVTTDPGVVFAKRRIVVTFGLALGLRVSKVTNSLRDWGVFASHKCQYRSGGRVRETQNCRHFWTPVGSSRLDSVNSHKGSGGRVRETQNCRHFWTPVGSSRLDSVNSHRDRWGPGRETENCRHFWTRVGFSVSKVSTVTGIGGSWRKTQNCRHF